MPNKLIKTNVKKHELSDASCETHPSLICIKRDGKYVFLL